jgi:hypothetical protein
VTLSNHSGGDDVDKKVIYGLAALALLVFAGMGGVMAFPFGMGLAAADLQGDWQTVREAVENGDYQAWRSAIESQLTEENFQKLKDAYGKHQEREEALEQFYEAMESGDYNTASELLPEIPWMDGGYGHSHRWKFRLEWPWSDDD